MPAYLTLESAKSRLSHTGTELPDDSLLIELIEDAEVIMEEWLHWSPAPAEYTRTLQAGRTGLVWLPFEPVIAVNKVTVNYPDNVGKPILGADIYSLWQKGASHIYVDTSHCSVDVEWVAGLDPLPRVFAQAVAALLNASKEKGSVGEFSFLYQPVSQVTMLSLPEGLTKQFAQPPSKRADEERAVIDQILLPLLSRYRQNFVFSAEQQQNGKRIHGS